MLKEYSTLQLLYGFLPCYKLDGNRYKEYSNIFDVTVSNDSSGLSKLLSKFDNQATLHQKNDFWRHFSTRIWSYDDFSFDMAPAAASLIQSALCFKIWFNPYLTYETFILSSLIPFAPKVNNKNLIAKLGQNNWHQNQIEYFKKNGEFDGVDIKLIDNGIDHEFFLSLLECNEKGDWTPDAWKQHCNLIVSNPFYNKNLVGVMQHEMMHIMWEHIVNHEDKDQKVHNIATDYAINQQVDFSYQLQNLLITNENKDFYNTFVIAIAKWKAKNSIKDQGFLKSLGLTIESSIDSFSKKINSIEEYFMFENHRKPLFSRSYKNILYQNKDSNFYYDVLMNLKNEINQDGAGGFAVDSHDLWSNEEGDNSEETAKGTGKKTNDSNDSNESGAGSGSGSGESEENSETKQGQGQKQGQGRSSAPFKQQHQGFGDLISKQEARSNFKSAAENAGFNPDNPEDLERALQTIPGLECFRDMFHDWFDIKTKNWKKELRIFLRKCANPTALDYTMIREHRAIDGVFPGRKRDMGFEVIIGLDTSGSISGEDFNDFMGQVYKMSKDCDLEKVRVIQCHTSISSDEVMKINSARKLKEFKIKEIGGTKMQPIFEKLKRERNKKPLILFTDGEIDHFLAKEYESFKHIIFLSRGKSRYKETLEKRGFKVICQDDEAKDLKNAS